MFFSPLELRRALEAAEVPAEPGDGRACVPRRGAAAVRRRELHGQAPLLRRKGKCYRPTLNTHLLIHTECNVKFGWVKRFQSNTIQ